MPYFWIIILAFNPKQSGSQCGPFLLPFYAFFILLSHRVLAGPKIVPNLPLVLSEAPSPQYLFKRGYRLTLCMPAVQQIFTPRYNLLCPLQLSFVPKHALLLDKQALLLDQQPLVFDKQALLFDKQAQLSSKQSSG